MSIGIHDIFGAVCNTPDFARHSISELVDEEVHFIDMGLFWTIPKRGQERTFHKGTNKGLHRYVCEHERRPNLSQIDTNDQMASTVAGIIGRQIKYTDVGFI